MKTTILLAAFILFSLPTFAQQKCGMSEVRQQLIREHPEILQFEKELEKRIQDYPKSNPLNAINARTVDTSTELIVPIVFHIFHENGMGNLPDSRIYLEMQKLNEYYNAANADLSLVIPQHKPLIGNMHITFRLANLDPQGNLTNGIIRYNTALTRNGGDNAKMDAWPRDKYMNVYVIDSMNFRSKVAAAFAHLPVDVKEIYNNRVIDGVIICQDYVGANVSPSGEWSTLSHELGHCLNLKHPWGNSNNAGEVCGDDDVDDTPVTKGFLSCPTIQQATIDANDSCGGTPNNTTGATNPPGTISNFQNIMDYSYCSKMFTKGQVLRVRNALLKDSIAQRYNLITPANLIATGTQNATPIPSPPKADFSVDKRFVCVGDAVKFTDFSYNGDIDSRNWVFTDADVNNSSLTSQIVHFNSTGWKTVSLTVYNTVGSHTTSKIMVYVADNSEVITAPFLESFENPQAAANWIPINFENDGTEFKKMAGTGYLSSNCMWLNSYKTPYDFISDQLISPPYDLTSLTAPIDQNMQFRYSFAKFTEQSLQDSIDKLQVLATKDCGLTWIQVYDLSQKPVDYIYPNLHNAGYLTAPFTPTMTSDSWRKVTIPLVTNNYNLINGGNNVRFKFNVRTSTTSNNFYLDNINVGNAQTGIEETTVAENFSIFPNPSTEKAQINIELTEAKVLTVKAFDLVGKEVGVLFEGKLTAGKNTISMESFSQTAGIYFIKLEIGGKSQQLKWVKL